MTRKGSWLRRACRHNQILLLEGEDSAYFDTLMSSATYTELTDTNYVAGTKDEIKFAGRGDIDIKGSEQAESSLSRITSWSSRQSREDSARD